MRSESATTSSTRGKRGSTKKERSFTTSFSVDESPAAVFAAINDVRGWWEGDIEGRTDKLGAAFTYRYEDMHRSTQKITELVPGKRVVWHVTDASLDFIARKTEWKGTDIVFEISRKDGKTAVRFTHVGLVPSCQCYEACFDGWSFYIQKSLPKLIKTAKGTPDPKGH
jgi:hypothetical protein